MMYPECIGAHQGSGGGRPSSAEETNADALNLLSKALYEIAEADWAMYLFDRLSDLPSHVRLHEHLLRVRDMLSARGHSAIEASIPHVLCSNIVETDAVVLSLRIHARQIQNALKRSFEEEASPLPPEEKALRLADFLAPVVRELIRRRNHCAGKLGGSSYAALLLDSLGLDMDELQHWLAETAHALGQLALGDLAIDSIEDSRWTSYNNQITRLKEEQEMLVEFCEDTVEQWAEFVGVGATELRAAIRPDAQIHGWCLPVDRPNDVRLVIRPGQEGTSLWLLLHELGHHLHYTIPVPEGWQLAAPPAVFDETMANLLELAGSVVKFPGQLERLVLRPVGQHGRRLHAAQERRWALSALFEMQACRANGESLDTLWAEMLQEHGFAAAFPHEWALDTFYIYDPVYRFNYVVGALWSAAELGRMAPFTLQDVAARIQELGQAAYGSSWRRVLGMDKSLPAPSAYIAWAENRQL
ncbi:MAG: hypothetical protein A2Z18_00795 [Armatimonadetes bacterium RBG_16_58_9]|nr:MAG: hypothetical protein A2Z18_00795 [Armatimonadetes bacterium RBG_16_58_9]